MRLQCRVSEFTKVLCIETLTGENWTCEAARDLRDHKFLPLPDGGICPIRANRIASNVQASTDTAGQLFGMLMTIPTAKTPKRRRAEALLHSSNRLVPDVQSKDNADAPRTCIRNASPGGQQKPTTSAKVAVHLPAMELPGGQLRTQFFHKLLDRKSVV